MPNLVSTYTTPLTPEEEYLLSLDAVAAEPVPPPAAAPATYTAPTTDAAQGYAIPPPAETAPPPASPSMAGPAPAEPTSYSNTDTVYVSQPATGGDNALRSVSTGETMAIPPPPAQRTDINSTPPSDYANGAPVVPLPGPPVGTNTDIYQLGEPVASYGGPSVADRVNANQGRGAPPDTLSQRAIEGTFNSQIARMPWNPPPEVLHPPPQFLSEPANDYAPPDSSLMDTRSLTERISQETPFRGIQQASYIPPPDPWQYEPGMYQNRPSTGTLDALEQSMMVESAPGEDGVTFQDIGDVVNRGITDPASFLPNAEPIYDSAGNPIYMSDAGMIFGPPIVDARFRSKAARTSPASAGPAITPRNRTPAPPVAAQEVPPPAVAAQEAAGSQTFPRLAGKPGTPAGPGAYWGPGGQIVYARQPSAVTEPVIALPSESTLLAAEPPPRRTTGRPYYGQAAGGVIPEPVAAGRPSMGQFGTDIGARSARRGRPAATEPPTSGTGRPADAATAETVPPPEAPAAPVGTATGTRRTIPRGRLAAVLAAGGVGGALLAANRDSRREAPGAVIDKSGAARAPLEPGIYSPSTNPSTPDEWNGATTRSLELMKSYSPDDWGAGTKRAAVEIGGIPQKLIESTEVPGLYVGYVDVNGNIVPVGNDVSPEDFVDMVIANAAEAPEGWGDTAATPDGGTTFVDNLDDMVGSGPIKTGGTTLADATIPAPADSGGGSSRSSGGGGSSRSSGSGRSSGGRSSGRDYGGDDFSRGYEREFTADDFMEAAGGNRRKAEFMAKAANRRRRKGKGRGVSGGMGGFWEGFPFNRPPSDIRTLVLNAIAESQAEGRARKQQR